MFVSPQDWTAPVPVGNPVRVYAFLSGASIAEAFVNGVSLGLRNVSQFGYADWGSVPFQSGNLTAVSYTDAGAVAATSTVLTVGPPVALRLSLINSSAVPRPYIADGVDVALIQCSVVDASGSVVPFSSHLVTFSVNGPGDIYGLANGDPADHTPDKVGRTDLPYGGIWFKQVFHGLALAIVQTRAGNPGSILVSASSPGVKGGNVTFFAAGT